MVRKLLFLVPLLTALLATSACAPEQKDPDPKVQGSYEEVRDELLNDKAATYTGNPYDYRVRLASEDSSVVIERRRNFGDDFVSVILFPLSLLTDVTHRSESRSSLENTRVAKHALLNGQIFVGRYFSRPIELKQSDGGIVSNYYWIFVKPRDGKNYSISDISLDPSKITLEIRNRRVLVNYPVIAHLQPDEILPIATSTYHVAVFQDAQDTKDDLQKVVKRAIAENHTVKIVYTNKDKLTLVEN